MLRLFRAEVIGTHLEAVPDPQFGEVARGLCGFLTGDIQGIAKNAEAVIREIDRIAADRTAFWQRVGNQYILDLDAKSARITDQYTDDKFELPLKVFRDAMLQWAEATT